jgi:mRNA-degrading endonuclease YafQ of YafQ-DinJ toxin-antitoxin module
MGQVDISKVRKQLKKVPKEVRVKFQQWILFLELKGVFEAQKFPGFRDHFLKGLRKGQRSVYLTKKWRAIYTLNKKGSPTIVIVEEVTPHDY